MTLITLFTSPKPFTDPHIATIQRNALLSWKELPDVDIIMLGDEEGMTDIASEMNIRHLPNVRLNDSGTPLISSMFELAREHSKSPLLCIVNADILLMDDITEASRKVMAQREKFLVIGQRWDLDVTEELDFAEGWQSNLRERVAAQGRLHPPAGSDYFIFPRACYTDIPDFAIGRAGWDNWMIYKARAAGWAAIDATPDVMIVHQNHDYRHLSGGQIHYNVPETRANIRMAGGSAVTHFTIRDVDSTLTGGVVRRAPFSLKSFARKLETLPLIAWNKPKLVTLFFAIFHPIRMFRRIMKRYRR